jgi:hypothetical protein
MNLKIKFNFKHPGPANPYRDWRRLAIAWLVATGLLLATGEAVTLWLKRLSSSVSPAAPVEAPVFETAAVERLIEQLAERSRQFQELPGKPKAAVDPSR